MEGGRGIFYTSNRGPRSYATRESARWKIEVRNLKLVSELLQKGKTRDIHCTSRQGAEWRANSRLSVRHLDKERVGFSQAVPEDQPAQLVLGLGC